jgi:hypothetical protein
MSYQPYGEERTGTQTFSCYTIIATTTSLPEMAAKAVFMTGMTKLRSRMR